MATQVGTCTGVPPCFRVDDEAADVPMLDARMFPVVERVPRRVVQLSPADLDDQAVCRKFGSAPLDNHGIPGVNVTVRMKDGSTRDITPAEREVTYSNRWFTRLRVRSHIVTHSDLGAWECCSICNNCKTPVYLANPHLRVQGEEIKSDVPACSHYVCLRCLLRRSFRQRGFGQEPSCPFCCASFDEDNLVPLHLVAAAPGE